MKYILSIFAATVVACSLIGCHKKDTDNTETNTLVLKPAGQTEELFYSIGSAFRGGSDHEEWASMGYMFFREKFTSYPRDIRPFITIDGRYFSGEQYTKPGQWIDSIAIFHEGNDFLGLDSPILIPMNQGVYNAGNEFVKDVRIDSFLSPDINIVITTKTGDVITIHFDGDIPWHGMV